MKSEGYGVPSERLETRDGWIELIEKIAEAKAEEKVMELMKTL